MATPGSSRDGVEARVNEAHMWEILRLYLEDKPTTVVLNNGMEEEDRIALQVIEELLNKNCSSPSTSSGEGSFQA
ncbi:hypothetical protein Syun_016748 [Stephania yunnanensis]|uniref:Uncharacterized protein n=1 Tax=Stephania yunnanensis TaxID=152371 RepID=A0AAP0J801_9MAGN